MEKGKKQRKKHVVKPTHGEQRYRIMRDSGKWTDKTTIPGYSQGAHISVPPQGLQASLR